MTNLPGEKWVFSVVIVVMVGFVEVIGVLMDGSESGDGVRVEGEAIPPNEKREIFKSTPKECFDCA